MTPEHRDLVAGDFNPADLAANYSCGHCHADVILGDTIGGITQVAIAHDPGCPVLTGTLPSAPDIARAVADTFRP